MTDLTILSSIYFLAITAYALQSLPFYISTPLFTVDRSTPPKLEIDPAVFWLVFAVFYLVVLRFQ